MNATRCVGLLLTYRDACRSARTIRSLLENDVDGVVVWDNSADGGASAAVLQSELPGESRVHLHVSQKNLGFAAGVNKGIELCNQLFPGCYVLLINDDAQLLPDAREALMRVLSEHPACAIAVPAIKQGGVVRRAAYYHRATGMLFNSRLPGCFAYASGCCMLVAIDRVQWPLFDEDFFMYGEDVELSWRLRHRPDAIRFVDKLLVEHEGSASSALGSEFYETQMVKAHLILVPKLTASGFVRALFISVRMLSLASRSCVRAIRFRSTIPMTAFIVGMRSAYSEWLHAKTQNSFRQ